MNRFDDPMVELLDDARQQEASAERARRRRISEADALDATLAGSLQALAERGEAVVLTPVAGQPVSGRIAAVTEEHVLVRTPRTDAWVRTDAVVSVRSRPGATISAVAPLGPARRTLLRTALEDAAADRASIEAVTDHGSTCRGQLLAAGIDVLTLLHDTTSERELVSLRRTAVLHLHRS